MGTVYEGYDQSLDRRVAIKTLATEAIADEDSRRRFEREARLLASLNHPNIATLFDLQKYEGTHFLVLEFVPGETLAERIKRGPIPLEEAVAIARQIAEAGGEGEIRAVDVLHAVERRTLVFMEFEYAHDVRVHETQVSLPFVAQPGGHAVKS